MRVENIGLPKNISEKAQQPVLSEGDILVAEVTDVRGDKVFLKNQNGGGVLTAKLLSDIGVAVGDFVETVVDEAHGGRYVLRVVDISRQTPFASETEINQDMQAQNQSVRPQTLLSTLAMLKNNPGAAPKAVVFLSRHGLAGTADNIETLSQMAKNSSTVTTLLSNVIKSLTTMSKEPASDTQQTSSFADVQNSLSAEGQAQNSISKTLISPTQSDSQIVGEQSITMQNNSSETTQVATQTAAVQIPLPDTKQMGSVQTTEGEMVRAETMETGTTNQTATQIETQIPFENQSSHQTSVQSPRAQVDSQMNVPTPMEQSSENLTVRTPSTVEDGTNMPRPASGVSETIGQAKTQVVAETTQQETVQHLTQILNTDEEIKMTQLPLSDTVQQGESTKIEVEKETVQTAPEEKNVISENKRTGDENQKQIEDRVRSMFVPLEDAEHTAVHLKKAVEELPNQLKELKLLINNADNTVKDAVEFDQIEKQMSLMSEVKRFDCYQIPLQTSTQQQATAELYVYKYRGGRKSVDSDNILILLGLDMEYMGRVETLVKTTGKALNIEFNLEDMSLGEEVKTEAAQLEKAVREAGYHFAGVSVKQLAARTTVLNVEERLEKETDGGTGNLDIRI